MRGMIVVLAAVALSGCATFWAPSGVDTPVSRGLVYAGSEAECYRWAKVNRARAATVAEDMAVALTAGQACLRGLDGGIAAPE